MFRVIFRNLAIPKNVGTDLLRIRLVSTAIPVEADKNEYNYVKLLGTIVTNVRTLPNGTKSLIVRTTEADDVYCNHHVNAITDEPMAAGERIYVFGNLSSKQFSLDDGRLRNRLTVKSRYIRLRGHERNVDNRSSDQNNVKIMAKVTSDMHHTDKYTLFTLASTHTPKGEGRTPGTVITEFHRVIVYDPAVQDTTHNIKKSDRILVDGKIGYMPYKLTNGKTQHGGFIVAQSIQVVNTEKNAN